MLKCSQSENLITERLFGTLSEADAQVLDAHLAQCESCRHLADELASALKTMDQRHRPDPGPAFWDGYWDRLSTRMSDQPSQSKPQGKVLTFQGWPLRALATAAVLVLGIFLGRLSLRPTSQAPAATPGATPVQMASLNQRTSDYLQRSKMLILGLVNFDAEDQESYPISLPRQQALSQELLTEATLIKSELQEPPQARLRQLVTDLEVILLQIANLESEHDMDAIEMVRAGVDRRGVLLKINLEEMKQASSTAPNQNHPPRAES